MSVAACTSFLEEVSESAELNQQLKSLTGVGEIVALGRSLGYRFDPGDLATASAAKGEAGLTPGEPSPDQEKQPEAAFYHYEFDLDALAGFEAVGAELDTLRIMPPDVKLTDFDRGFRADDLATLEQCPADESYQRWHTELAAAHWQGGNGLSPRRDFHLINLDEHIDHPGYAAYFASKQRIITGLEQVLGGEVRFSGSLWYPPNSYRLWHTNETQPGWRMYLIDLDEPFAPGEQPSYFRYMNPTSQEVVTLPERRRLVRFFRIEQEPDKLFWHCIANPSNRHRWSFGFAIPDGWQQRVSEVVESR